MRIVWLCVFTLLLACSPQTPPEPSTAVTMTGKTTQIIAQWSDAAGLDELFVIEDTIIEAAGDLFEVDGHDVGSGTFNVFIYADDGAVDATVAKLIQLREKDKVPNSMKIGVAQYTNAERSDWTFKPVYPAGLKSFELM
jgi:hypothetical protein